MCEYKVLNTFCGKLPLGHQEVGCHNASEEKRRMLCKLKKIVQEYDSRAKCEEWDTAGTLNNTKGPYRFGVYRPTRKPWDRNRVKSQELIGGEMHSHCLCIKRNGLQDECRRRQCRGSPQCRLQPFPSCPPFTMVPAPIPVEDPFKTCKNRPKPVTSGVWAVGRKDPPTAGQAECVLPASCTLTCPSTGAARNYDMTPADNSQLPPQYRNLPGVVYKLNAQK